mmetsp:Transcript_18413/g.59904  ORF Transcript_18413/g.59904 Transcript_18413/m.59904 type:complete len:247 (+) Transcript_18413:1002-1742(+)
MVRHRRLVRLSAPLFAAAAARQEPPRNARAVAARGNARRAPMEGRQPRRRLAHARAVGALQLQLFHRLTDQPAHLAAAAHEALLQLARAAVRHLRRLYRVGVEAPLQASRRAPPVPRRVWVLQALFADVARRLHSGDVVRPVPPPPHHRQPNPRVRARGGARGRARDVAQAPEHRDQLRYRGGARRLRESAPQSDAACDHRAPRPRPELEHHLLLQPGLVRENALRNRLQRLRRKPLQGVVRELAY